MSSYSEPASETAKTAAKQFLAGIKRKEDPARAAACLGKTTKIDIMRWVDDDNLDLMHHVIILNIAEAAEYLLSHGYFQVKKTQTFYETLLETCYHILIYFYAIR